MDFEYLEQICNAVIQVGAASLTVLGIVFVAVIIVKFIFDDWG